ncbi:DUF5039 family protein [uncultured Bacteroides sp.]|uniref:DUF5039 family protein n=1 Tax=uncultured Bacteroides sp. TaxID=162156 RepID=UPI0025D6A901|nr:DUF5039 family protein [uncultured Bacteroides sp.]
MRKINTLLLLLLCNIVCLQAQENRIVELEKSLEIMRTDLQQKKLLFSWTLMEKYLDACSASNKLVNIKNEPKLTYIIFELKPQELAASKEAYETAKDELKKMLNTYSEYTQLDSAYRNTAKEETRKEINVAMNNFYRRLSDENKDYRPMRDKEQKALRSYYIAAARYMLEESKNKQEVVPNGIIDYKERENILNSNAALNQLSVEIRLLENLQREVLQEYQKLKYHITPSK